MPTAQYLAKIDACQSNEAIVAAVNEELILYRDAVGHEVFDEGTEDWHLGPFGDVDEVREASTALRGAQDERDASEVLEEVSGILDAGMYRYHAIARPR